MKKIFCICAVFVLGLVMASCEPTTEDGKINITFWHAMGAENQVVIQEMIDSFELKYPNYNVEQLSQGGYTDLRDKILTAIPVGETPSLAQTYPDHVAAYLRTQAVKEMDSFINSTDPEIGLSVADKADFVSKFYEEGTVYDAAGTMYSMPFNKSTEVMFYNATFFYNHKDELAPYGVVVDESKVTVDDDNNKSVLNAVSWNNPTWEQVEEISKIFLTSAECKDVQAKDNGALKDSVAGFAVDSQANLFITLTQQWGGTYTSFDNGVGAYSFGTDQKSKDAITWFKGNVDAGLFGTVKKFGTAYSSNAFINGQCAISLGSSAGASYNNPNGKFEAGIATYPQRAAATEAEKQVIQQGTNVTMFRNLNPEVEKATWLFIKHITNQENALKWCTGTAYFPTRNSVYNSPEYTQFLNSNSIIARAQKVGWTQQSMFYTSPAFLGSSRARDQVEILIDAVVSNSATVDEAYAAALANCLAIV